MAYIQDSTQSFTISLTGLLEGLGIITHIRVTNSASGIVSTWTLATGTWDNSPEAIEGDWIVVGPSIQNQGAVTDIIWGEFSSAQVTPGEALRQEGNVDPGMYPNIVWSFYMPAENVTITINAGHVE